MQQQAESVQKAWQAAETKLQDLKEAAPAARSLRDFKRGVVKRAKRGWRKMEPVREAYLATLPGVSEAIPPFSLAGVS